LVLNSPYKFMLPTAIAVSTCCQLCGIGGAALFSPIFLLLFPLLGLSLPSPSAAIASALLTEVFGFSSGLVGFTARGLVDWRVAGQFLAVTLPTALVGARLAGSLAAFPTLLRVAYAALMLSLSLFLIFTSPNPERAAEIAAQCELPLEESTTVRSLVDSQGNAYAYLPPKTGDAVGTAATAFGGLLTGILGVGAGEVSRRASAPTAFFFLARAEGGRPRVEGGKIARGGREDRASAPTALARLAPPPPHPPTPHPPPPHPPFPFHSLPR
jgi:uncharacterized membrane protein YfcA